jgi:hypothetical protein
VDPELALARDDAPSRDSHCLSLRRLSEKTAERDLERLAFDDGTNLAPALSSHDLGSHGQRFSLLGYCGCSNHR